MKPLRPPSASSGPEYAKRENWATEEQYVHASSHFGALVGLHGNHCGPRPLPFKRLIRRTQTNPLRDPEYFTLQPVQASHLIGRPPGSLAFERHLPTKHFNIFGQNWKIYGGLFCRLRLDYRRNALPYATDLVRTGRISAIAVETPC